MDKRSSFLKWWWATCCILISSLLIEAAFAKQWEVVSHAALLLGVSLMFLARRLKGAHSAGDTNG